ncbi:hypothetical protein B0H11DRAFT_1032383 [Mycena galericulata]|nr:hypothetical protein B0H11DRAFT_1032383 [Mycena galericulata]
MFILPAHAHPAALAGVVGAHAHAHWHTWSAPLALLAALTVLLLIRHVLRSASLTPALPVSDKAAAAAAASFLAKPTSALPAAEAPAAKWSSLSTWLPLRLSWETLPASPPAPTAPSLKPSPSPSTPRSAAAPPPPPPSHAHAPVRAGALRRPEPALQHHQHQGVEAPLPALYACQTPASMARLIMSRHVSLLSSCALLFSCDLVSCRLSTPPRACPYRHVTLPHVI